MSDSDELKAKIDNLSPVGVRFVTRYVDSIGNPPVTSPGTAWLSHEWAEAFGLVISVHHGTTTEPLGTESFEIGFRTACETLKWEMSPPGTSTQRFLDINVTPDDGQLRKLSLKTTKAEKLSETKMHISKLTEAAWIQDMRSAAERRRRTLELFRLFRETVDSILMFRAFRPKGMAFPIRYQLVEMPGEIFASLEQAPLAAFAADGPTIDCEYAGNPKAARVSLDRSDAKITIKDIQLSVCTIHGVWELEGSPSD